MQKIAKNSPMSKFQFEHFLQFFSPALLGKIEATTTAGKNQKLRDQSETRITTTRYGVGMERGGGRSFTWCLMYLECILKLLTF